MKLDEIDKKILSFLLRDSRRPYAEMAKMLGVATGTVHARYEKMRQQGIITGSKIQIDPAQLGFQVMAFVGINLRRAGDYKQVLKTLELFDEIVEAHYTTGKHSIFTKIMTRDIQGLHRFLVEKLQPLEEVQSTETLICLGTPIQRDLLP